jgi:hypothetical protein
MKSKREKAAEKIADKLGAQDVWEKDLAKRAAIKGAEALLRYAKQIDSRPATGMSVNANYGRNASFIKMLEEWVKGEK